MISMIEIWKEMKRGSEYLRDKGSVISKGIKKQQAMENMTDKDVLLRNVEDETMNFGVGKKENNK